MKAHQNKLPQSNSNKEISIDNFKFVLNKKQTIANNFFFKKIYFKESDREGETRERIFYLLVKFLNGINYQTKARSQDLRSGHPPECRGCRRRGQIGSGTDETRQCPNGTPASQVVYPVAQCQFALHNI